MIYAVNGYHDHTESLGYSQEEGILYNVNAFPTQK